jgi:hypothetical protein
MFVTCFFPHSVVFDRSLLAINEIACIILPLFFLFSYFILWEIIHYVLPKTMHASRHDGNMWGKDIVYVA